MELICSPRAPPVHDHSHGSVLLVSSSGEKRERHTLQSFMRVHSQKLNFKFRLEGVHVTIAVLRFCSEERRNTVQPSNLGVLSMLRSFRIWLNLGGKQL